ncbi:unnamed protein product [Agarophyton chilense]
MAAFVALLPPRHAALRHAARPVSPIRIIPPIRHVPRRAPPSIHAVLQSPPSSTTTPAASRLSYLAPRALLLLVAAIWGTNFAFVKHVQTSALSPSLCACARFTLASLVTLPFLSRVRFSAPFLRDASVIGLFVFLGYFTQALSLSGVHAHASTSAFCCSLAVVIVPLLQRSGLSLFATKSNQSFLSLFIPALLAVAGVTFLEASNGLPFGTNDIFALLQAVAFAAGFALNERATAKYPDQVLDLSSIQLAVVAALSTLWSLSDTGTFAISETFSTVDLSLCTLYTGVVTTALAVWLQNVALKRVHASEMAVLLSTEPLWAAALASFLCGETMQFNALIGAFFILSACVSKVVINDNNIDLSALKTTLSLKL